MLELTVGLVCSCLPALNMMFNRSKKPREWLSSLSQCSCCTHALVEKCRKSFYRRSSTKPLHPAARPPGYAERDQPSAPLGAHPVDIETNIPAIPCPVRMADVRELDEPFVPRLERLTSAQGMKEGWLAPGRSCRRDFGGERAGVVNCSWELPRISANTLHDSIWDGDITQLEWPSTPLSSPDRPRFSVQH